MDEQLQPSTSRFPASQLVQTPPLASTITIGTPKRLFSASQRVPPSSTTATANTGMPKRPLSASQQAPPPTAGKVTATPKRMRLNRDLVDRVEERMAKGVLSLLCYHVCI